MSVLTRFLSAPFLFCSKQDIEISEVNNNLKKLGSKRLV